MRKTYFSRLSYPYSCCHLGRGEDDPISSQKRESLRMKEAYLNHSIEASYGYDEGQIGEILDHSQEALADIPDMIVESSESTNEDTENHEIIYAQPETVLESGEAEILATSTESIEVAPLVEQKRLPNLILNKEKSDVKLIEATSIHASSAVPVKTPLSKGQSEILAEKKNIRIDKKFAEKVPDVFPRLGLKTPTKIFQVAIPKGFKSHFSDVIKKGPLSPRIALTPSSESQSLPKEIGRLIIQDVKVIPDMKAIQDVKVETAEKGTYYSDFEDAEEEGAETEDEALQVEELERMKR